MNDPRWFANMEREMNEREDYIAEAAAERRIVRERCWQCCGVGRVYVPDGTAFPPLVDCAICGGSGSITTERQP